MFVARRTPPPFFSLLSHVGIAWSARYTWRPSGTQNSEERFPVTTTNMPSLRDSRGNIIFQTAP